MALLFLLGTALAALLVTVAAAWLVVRRRPHASQGAQVLRAAASFPLLAVILFAIGVVLALSGTRADRPDMDPGMPIFAMTFFLVYALGVGCAVGVPAAFLAVRRFRGG